MLGERGGGGQLRVQAGATVVSPARLQTAVIIILLYQPDRDRKYLPAGMEIFFISVVGVVTELKDVM